MHLTETCEADAPNLITHVETTKSTEQDNMAVTRIHNALETKGLLPAQHIVDSGYMSAELLVDSQIQHGIDLLGPTRPDVRWQSHDEEGFAVSEFQINLEKRVVTCPMGKLSCTWATEPDHSAPTAAGGAAVRTPAPDHRAIQTAIRASLGHRNHDSTRR